MILRINGVKESKQTKKDEIEDKSGHRYLQIHYKSTVKVSCKQIINILCCFISTGEKNSTNKKYLTKNPNNKEIY